MEIIHNKNTFNNVIDLFIANYYIYEKGKVEFNFDYGELTFNKINNEVLILSGIYIFPEYRKKGYCREILHYLIDKSSTKFKYICIESVISKILYNYLIRFEYNKTKFKCKKNGFYYKLKDQNILKFST
jgi:hypothetical protein